MGWVEQIHCESVHTAASTAATWYVLMRQSLCIVIRLIVSCLCLSACWNQQCVDTQPDQCPGWKKQGQCDANPLMMRKECRLSCHDSQCENQRPTCSSMTCSSINAQMMNDPTKVNDRCYGGKCMAPYDTWTCCKIKPPPRDPITGLPAPTTIGTGLGAVKCTQDCTSRDSSVADGPVFMVDLVRGSTPKVNIQGYVRVPPLSSEAEGSLVIDDNKMAASLKTSWFGLVEAEAQFSQSLADAYTMTASCEIKADPHLARKVAAKIKEISREAQKFLDSAEASLLTFVNSVTANLCGILGSNSLATSLCHTAMNVAKHLVKNVIKIVADLAKAALKVFTDVIALAIKALSAVFSFESLKIAGSIKNAVPNTFDLDTKFKIMGNPVSLSLSLSNPLRPQLDAIATSTITEIKNQGSVTKLLSDSRKIMGKFYEAKAKAVARAVSESLTQFANLAGQVGKAMMGAARGLASAAGGMVSSLVGGF
jgi:hypothetical protein